MKFSAAVVIPTTLRPALERAVRSVFAQDLAGKIQILVGIDKAMGDRSVLQALQRDQPDRVTLTIVDLGYSTSRRHGGIYGNWSGGALRTILSYAANSPYVAYLDDDNWWAPSHLSDLVAAIDGNDFAFSYRWFVDPETQQPVCRDDWESVGPGRGIHKSSLGGFVDTNCLMLNKQKCHWLLPAWCVAANSHGDGVDKTLIRHLLRRKKVGNCSGNATVYYVARKRQMVELRELLQRNSAGP